MSSLIYNITFDCADPRALARFWGQRPEIGWVLMADHESNEFDVEISVAGLEAARSAEANTGTEPFSDARKVP